jgi:hypothetical protein
VEGDLLFEFDEEVWNPVVCWDRHPAYRTGISQTHEGKCVDFIGVRRDGVIFFIEVKDYRVNKRRKPMGPWEEFELKVRNTVAGLVGAGRRDAYIGVCTPFLNALVGRNELNLVYWVELPPARPASPGRERWRLANAGFAARQTARTVRWLNAKAFTASQDADYQRLVPGLKVQNLPRKRRELAEAVENKLRSRGIDIVESVQHRISQELDLNVLQDWLNRAATVLTAQELFSGRP